MIYFDPLKKISEKPWFYPVALLFIGLITYGYVLTSLGYYWADWEIVMFTKLNPALQFGYYAHDRPFPWTYQLIYSLIGSNPIGWHIVTLLIRWAGTLVFVQCLILLWPRYKNHFLWFGALLLVYPGFLQQSQSATKSRHFMTFLLFALSIYWMVLAIKRPKWARILFPLSWLATFAHLFTTEYFAGLELLRPVLLWMLLEGDRKWELQRVRRVALNYLPYFLITVFYFWCRIFYFPAVFQTTSRIGRINELLTGVRESMATTLSVFFNQALLDFIYLTVQTWVNGIINYAGFTFQSKVAWFAFAVGILLTIAFAFFYDASEQDTPDRSSPALVFLSGFALFIFGAIPIWAIGEQISAGSWNDRFALAPMLGATLMVVALVFWFLRPSAQKWALGFLLVFSIAAQVWVVNVYRRDWETQREYYWQLYWRAPALQPGTALFTFEQPSLSVTHYSDAGFALNVLYHYKTEDGTLPYWFLSRRVQFDYQPNDPFSLTLRTLTFNGNTSNGIAVVHQTNISCLRVLDTVYAGDPLFVEGQDILIPLSTLSRIIPDPNAPPPDPDIFGPEPPHDWCYFFEKADLARQTKDWDTAIALYQQTKKAGLAPNFGGEYIPFIEAYAQTDNWQKAYELTLAAQKVNSGMKKMFCANWLRWSQIPSADRDIVEKAKQSLSCTNF